MNDTDHKGIILITSCSDFQGENWEEKINMGPGQGHTCSAAKRNRRETRTRTLDRNKEDRLRIAEQNN
jgi:hypothetical protein